LLRTNRGTPPTTPENKPTQKAANVLGGFTNL
jgi:hypothetical protein